MSRSLAGSNSAANDFQDQVRQRERDGTAGLELADLIGDESAMGNHDTLHVEVEININRAFSTIRNAK